MQTCQGREAEVRLSSFLTSAVDKSEWLIPRPGRFNPMKEPCTCPAPVCDLNTGPSRSYPSPYPTCYVMFMCVEMFELSERSVPHPWHNDRIYERLYQPPSQSMKMSAELQWRSVQGILQLLSTFCTRTVVVEPLVTNVMCVLTTEHK
jgi:hypothetical protein